MLVSSREKYHGGTPYQNQNSKKFSIEIIESKLEQFFNEQIRHEIDRSEYSRECWRVLFLLVGAF